MNPSSTRSRSLYGMTVIALVVLSLRPIPAVERFLDTLLAPTRVLAELAVPFHWLRARVARAAERGLTDRVAVEVRESRNLLAVERRHARPTDPALLAGRGALHAEVVARSVGNLDQIVIQLPDRARVLRGLPVVAGDTFVGRIARVDTPRPGQATVDLVTGDDFFIGARLVPGPDVHEASDGFIESEFVVGGLAPSFPGDEREISLAVHNPRNREATTGLAVVDEPTTRYAGLSGGRRTAEREDVASEAIVARLANGFLLGRLEVLDAEPSQILRLVPELDYKEGLYQVLVLAPVELASGVGTLPDAFDDRRWTAARVFLRGAPSFWRDSRKLSRGRAHGIEVGAALAYGARFAGRVRQVGLFTSDAGLLGDAGLVVPALAELEVAPGQSPLPPLPLGHLVSLGRDRETGAVRLRWEAVLPVPAAAPTATRGDGTEAVRARLYTGSGEEGVPRGLLIGDTLLPRGTGTFELKLTPDPALEELSRVRVRSQTAAVDPRTAGGAAGGGS